MQEKNKEMTTEGYTIEKMCCNQKTPLLNAIVQAKELAIRMNSCAILDGKHYLPPYAVLFEFNEVSMYVSGTTNIANAHTAFSEAIIKKDKPKEVFSLN